MRALDRRGVSPADLAVGVALTALGVLISLSPDSGGDPSWVRSLLVTTVTLPVIWRRRAPLACAGALAAGTVLSAIPTFDQVRCGAAIPAALLVLYAVGARSERSGAFGGLALVLGGMVFLSLTDPSLGVAAPGFIVPLCVGVWAAGLRVRSLDGLASALAARAGELADRRQRTARLAVEVERTRLAAELDAAARSRVREVLALTERGERAMARDPARAEPFFTQIERAGRASLNELRGLLGVLRDGEPPERTPLPTLAQLGALLDAARADGRVVELDVDGERRPLPDGVELAAYRLIERALSVIDGSGSRPVTVSVRYCEKALELEVAGEVVEVDGGRDTLATARERVWVQGGSFSVHRSGPGRTVVRAQLPIAVAHA